MDKIYDNGALMLGNIKMVIKEIEKEIENDLDMGFVDQNELLEELKELITDDENMVVCINYENPICYGLDYWYERDIVKECD